MGDHVKSRHIVRAYEIDGRTFTVERIIWVKGSRPSFDIYDEKTRQCLTGESFDDEPTEDDVRDHLQALREQYPDFADPFIEGDAANLRPILFPRHEVQAAPPSSEGTEASPEEGLLLARRAMVGAGERLDKAVRRVVAAKVRAAYPTAFKLIAHGEDSEDGLLHLHTTRIIDSSGAPLADYEDHQTAAFDALTDEIDALLDELSERNDDYRGEHEFLI